jgi:predicted phosphodiesterase
MSKLVSVKYIEELLEKFPDVATMTLAKKAYKDQPKLFISLENARNLIRYRRGQSGSKHRKRLIDKTHIKELTYDTNPFKLPESKTEPRETLKLPKSLKKVLILSDIHFPYHDNKAITAALKFGKDENIDAIFINGDLMDFYQLSFHEKDPRLTSIPDELDMAREFFKSLHSHFPKALIYYIPGNHEYRLERYLRIKAPELLDMTEFKLDVILKCGELKVNYIAHGTKCYFGKLLVEHGDKMKGAGGVNPARTLSLRLKRHAICGHFHRTQENTSKIYDGEVIVTYSTGCLCELEPRYLEINEHNHGFAIVEMDGDNFTVLNKKIINGKVF